MQQTTNNDAWLSRAKKSNTNTRIDLPVVSLGVAPSRLIFPSSSSGAKGPLHTCLRRHHLRVCLLILFIPSAWKIDMWNTGTEQGHSDGLSGHWGKSRCVRRHGMLLWIVCQKKMLLWIVVVVSRRTILRFRSPLSSFILISISIVSKSWYLVRAWLVLVLDWTEVYQ